MSTTIELQLVKIKRLKNAINDEIKKAQIQLSLAEEKLERLQSYFRFYIGLCLIPVALVIASTLGIWIGNGEKLTDQMIGKVFFDIMWVFIIAYLVYIQPVMIFCLIKTALEIKANNIPDDEAVPLPPPRPKSTLYREPFTHNENITYALEKRKLQMVLSKYFMYLEQIEQLEEEVKKEVFLSNPEELDLQLDQFILYTPVPTATPFNESSKKATRNTKIIIAIVTLIILALLTIKLIF